MYLVPQDIYEKLLTVIDTKENVQLQKLNKIGVGNEDGAFPNLNLTPPSDDGIDPGQPGPGHPELPSSRPSRDSSMHTAIETESSVHAPQPFFYDSSESGSSNPRNASSSISGEMPPRSRGNRQLKHKCDVCKALFHTKIALRHHMKEHGSHSSGNPINIQNSLIPDLKQPENCPRAAHKCDICAAAFQNAVDLRSHMRIHSKPATGVHPRQPSFHYNDEDFPPLPTFDSGSNLLNPSSDQVRLGDYNDDGDDEMSDGNDELRRLTCLICDKEFFTSKSLQQHFIYCRRRLGTGVGMKQDKTKRLTAKKMDMWVSFRGKNSKPLKLRTATLTESESDEDSIAAHECEYCSFTFSRKEALLRHLRNAHDITNHPRGEKRRSSAAKLKSPQPSKVLKVAKRFNCAICGKVFRDVEPLNKHLLKSHQNQRKALDSQNLLSCKLCKHFFSVEKTLNRHLKNIHNCNSKYETFNDKGVKRKRGTSSLSCQKCGKKFSSLFNLQEHKDCRQTGRGKTHQEKYASWN